jgi:uncharacterized membrane protein YhiD involved in acid resistance
VPILSLQSPASLRDLLDGALLPLGGSTTTLLEALLHLLLAFVLSLPLAVVYVRTHHGMSYSRGYVQSLVLLSLVVTAVMMAVGDSLARAFGLFGALALIRFRTPVKDTRDATYLFLAVGIGICTGVQNLLLAIVGAAFAMLVALVLHFGRFGERLHSDGMLRFCMPGKAEQEGRLRQVLAHYCRTFALVRLGAGAGDDELEYAYQLQLHDREHVSGLVADVEAIPGASRVQLLMQSSHEED